MTFNVKCLSREILYIPNLSLSLNINININVNFYLSWPAPTIGVRYSIVTEILTIEMKELQRFQWSTVKLIPTDGSIRK